MNKKLLYTALFLFAFSAFFAGAALWHNKSETSVLRGDLLFQTTVNASLDVGKIAITTPEYKVTLVQNGDFWRVAENHDYYANLVLVNDLLIFLNEARIFNTFGNLPEQIKDNGLENPAEPDTDKEYAGVLIETFNNKNQKLDSIIIGERQGEYLKARQSGDSLIWLVNRKFDMPARQYSWLLEPLIDINTARVAKIRIDSANGSRIAVKADNSPYFYDTKGLPVEVLPLLGQFVYLIFSDVVDETSFKPAAAKEGNTFCITMDNGLIYNLKLFEKEQNYYIALSLSSTPLPTTVASDYIKDNAFLYSNWYFQIQAQKGRLLFNY